MNVNEALRASINKVSAFDTPTNDDAVAMVLPIIKSDIGQFPSIDLLEKIVSHFKARRNAILRDDIPCILAEYGLNAAEIDDGTEVALETAYEAKQLDEDKVAAWLISKGYGAIIKDTFSFEKGEVDDDLIIFLAEHGYSYTRNSSINGKSLTATIKKHLEAGGERPPADAIEVKVFGYAKVKPPKKGF